MESLLERSRNLEGPLDAYIKNNDIKGVKALLESGFSVGAGGFLEITPLMTAAFYGRIELMRILIKAKADLYAMAIDGRTVLSEAAVGKNPKEALQVLEENNIFGAESIHYYVKRNDFKGVMRCLKNGVSADAIEHIIFGNTPLMLAGWYGYFRLMKLLVLMGGDINATNNPGYNVLAWVIYSRHTRLNIEKTIKMFLDWGFDLKIETKYPATYQPLAFSTLSIEMRTKLESYKEALIAEVKAFGGNQLLDRKMISYILFFRILAKYMVKVPYDWVLKGKEIPLNHQGEIALDAIPLSKHCYKQRFALIRIYQEARSDLKRFTDTPQDKTDSLYTVKLPNEIFSLVLKQALKEGFIDALSQYNLGILKATQIADFFCARLDKNWDALMNVASKPETINLSNTLTL